MFLVGLSQFIFQRFKFVNLSFAFLEGLFGVSHEGCLSAYFAGPRHVDGDLHLMNYTNSLGLGVDYLGDWVLDGLGHVAFLGEDGSLVRSKILNHIIVLRI